MPSAARAAGTFLDGSMRSTALGILLGIITMAVENVGMGFLVILILVGIAAISYFLMIKKRKRSVRRLEMFDIQSSSGSTFSISMISDEWLKIKRNLYHKKANWMEGVIQDYTTRSEEEKIIHAIRKMIEEKKVSVNE